MNANADDSELEIWHYENRYAEGMLSTKPRLEIIWAMITIGLSLGLLCSVIPRTSLASAQAIWFLLCFFGPLIYHLREGFYSFSLLVDEGVYRLAARMGWTRPAIYGDGWLERIPRMIFAAIASGAVIAFLGWIVEILVSLRFPLEAAIVRPPYSGGG